MPDKNAIVIIGAGWAGLACAIKLTQAGQHAHVVEAAPHYGGRARKVPLNEMCIDNGHHIFIGAYLQTLSLLASIGVNEQSIFKRTRFELHVKDRHNEIHFPRSMLPSPLNLASSILFASGITIKSKVLAIAKGRRLKKIIDNLSTDTTVEQVFTTINYPDDLVSKIWQPLCLAITNSDIDEASALNFFRAINLAFYINRHGSDLLFPITNLSSVFPDKAVHYLQSHGAKITMNCRVRSVNIKMNNIAEICTQNNMIAATHVVVAVPPNAAVNILSKIPAINDLVHQLEQFTYMPICTVYLKYPENLILPFPIVGSLGTTMQWLLDRQYDNQVGVVAAIISGKGPHEHMSTTELSHVVQKEISDLFPHFPQPDLIKVIREKRATFHCKSGIDKIRPANNTSINSLWLAGDYTDTGLPATLEGAIQSGVKCAEQLLASINESK